MNPTPEYETITEAAARFDVCTKTLARREGINGFPCRVVFGENAKRFKKSELDEWAAKPANRNTCAA